MFAGESDAAGIAKGIVDYLADHNRFLSHGRRVDINTLASRKVKIYDIVDKGPTLWSHLEAYWYTTIHTFSGTGTIKMWENSRGIGHYQKILVQLKMVPTEK